MSKSKLTGSFLTLLIIAAMLGSVLFAWFAMNSELRASGMEVKAASVRPFWLATKGSNSRHKLLEESSLGLKHGRTEVIDGDTYYATDEEEPAVYLRVDGDSNFANDAPGKELYPGKFGSITFYLIFEEAANASLELVFDLQPDGYVFQNDELFDIYSTNLTDTASISNIIKGHVRFFGGYNQGSGYYSNPAVDGKLTMHLEQNNSRVVPVTVYWYWVPRFDNFYRGSAIAKTLFPIGSQEYETLLDDMRSNPECYFVGSEDIDLFENGEVISVQNCRNFYNNADELLGTHLDYIGLRIISVT